MIHQVPAGSNTESDAAVNVHAKPGGILVDLHDGQLMLQVKSDRVIRVLFTPTDRKPDDAESPIAGEVVVGEWEQTPFDLLSTEKSVGLSTSQVRVEVDKATGALAFLDTKGNVILREPLNGGRLMEPAVVNGEESYRPGQTFIAPSDECLYGLGQHVEGIWNWRGIPVELRQCNTTASLPMLVSSKGYGLLWNNAALTDFNPADTAVPADGTFSTGDAGEYVFMVRGGDGQNHLGIEMDGRVLVEVQNPWAPMSISAKVELPANTTVHLRILGGGPNPKLYARPIGNTTTFRSEVGDCIDYLFFYGPRLDDVIRGYREATGQAPLWPKWTQGFWQCRERYSSQQQIVDTAAEFRARKIPIDLIIQDWLYWGSHGWGAYQWDLDAYPDPAKMIADLHALNLKYMISIWSNPEGLAHDTLEKANAVIAGTNWMDVFNPEARRIRWEYMNDVFFKNGVDAWWQDATEPGDDGNALVDKSTYVGSGNRVRNAYPLFASKSAYDGQMSTGSQKRFVNLTRSAFPGQQRYASATWSGDVTGDWITLRRQIPAGLNFCATGIPYWTTDAGGFFRPQDQYASEDYNELLVRWFQWSTFTPILRIHGYQSETEIWKFPRSEENLRRYIELRYRMLPYNYSMSWMVAHSGYTQMRALAFDFSDDARALGVDDEYMYGPAFLVCPVTSAKATSRQVYLPGDGLWYDFWTGATQAGGKTVDADAPISTMPLFVRAGSIVPLGQSVQYATEKPSDPIELRVYAGADGEFTLYDDEGDNYGFEKGAHATIPIHWDDARMTLVIGDRAGTFPGILERCTFHIVWVSNDHGTGIEPTEQPDVTVEYTGERVEVKRS